MTVVTVTTGKLLVTFSIVKGLIMNISQTVFQATWDAAMKVAKEQKALAKMTGISEPALSKMKERKSLSFENYCKLLNVASRGGFSLTLRAIPYVIATAAALQLASDSYAPTLLINIALAPTGFVLCLIAGATGLIYKGFFLATRSAERRTNALYAFWRSRWARYAL